MLDLTQPSTMTPEGQPERWRPVVGFPGYEVSDYGRVRSWKHPHRQGQPLAVPNVLTPTVNKRCQYAMVGLCATTGRKRLLVHRLVLEAFVGPCPEGMECRHFPDRTRTNCRLDNLTWGTREQNAADRERDGNTARGCAVFGSRLCDGNARVALMLCSLPKHERPSLMAIGAAFGADYTTIGRLKRGKTWRHVHD